MWTGLAECSFALPVDLFASLPAFGWLSELQGTLPVVFALFEVAEVVVGLLAEVVDEVDGDCVAFEVVDFVVDGADCVARVVDLFTSVVALVVDWA